MKNKKLVPQIRFKGFNDEWETKNLSEILIRFYNPVTTPLNGYARLGIRSHAKGTFYTYIKKGEELKTGQLYRVKKDVFIVNITFAWEQAVAITNKLDANKLVSQRFPQFNFLENMFPPFFKNIINTEKFKYHLWFSSPGGAGRNRVLNINEMLKFLVIIPVFKEQQKLSSFFDKIDTLISKKQMKLEKIKALKQTLLKKMFPNDNNSVPEIRFKGFTENWEKKKLGDIGDTYSGLTGKKKNDFGHGNALYIPYLNIFKNPIIDNGMLEPIEIDFKQNKVLYGDIFFTTSSETPEEVGMSSVWLNNLNNIYLNSFCFGYRLNNINEYNLLYFTYLLRSLFVRKKIAILAQGISRYNISKNKLMELKILFTGKQEQEKIGKYFYKLDKLINLYEKEIEKLTNLKKAFLKKMFV